MFLFDLKWAFISLNRGNERVKNESHGYWGDDYFGVCLSMHLANFVFDVVRVNNFFEEII